MGIGEAIAEYLAKEGSYLILISRSSVNWLLETSTEARASY
jgi:short-subunit dehydrogenase